MSIELTPAILQEISVKCVSQYMSKQASLSEAICKEAMALELNPDQIQRTVEQVNTLAYLRQLEDAKDRTFEFPLADYKDVMAHMTLPELDKSASEDKEKCDEDDKKEEKEDEDKKKSKSDSESKEKSEDEAKKKDNPFERVSEQEKVAMLSREVLRCHQVLEKMAFDKEGLKIELVDNAALVGKSELALEKIAEVVAEEDFDAMLALCGIEKKAAKNVVLTDDELLQARVTYSLYKEAKALVNQEAEMVEFVKRASALLEKEAFLGALAKGVGRMAGAGLNTAGRVAAGGAVAATKPARNFVRNIYKKQGFMGKDGNGGVLGVATAATAGMTIDHKNDVWKNLQK